MPWLIRLWQVFSCFVVPGAPGMMVYPKTGDRTQESVVGWVERSETQHRTDCSVFLSRIFMVRSLRYLLCPRGMKVYP